MDNLIKFNCVYRGEIQVKNKGMMQMYFVNDINELTKEPGQLNS